MSYRPTLRALRRARKALKRQQRLLQQLELDGFGAFDALYLRWPGGTRVAFKRC